MKQLWFATISTIAMFSAAFNKLIGPKSFIRLCVCLVECYDLFLKINAAQHEFPIIRDITGANEKKCNTFNVLVKIDV